MHKTRKEAKACGATHYFTGKQCKNGHIEVRIVSCGTCLACALGDEYADANAADCAFAIRERGAP